MISAKVEKQIQCYTNLRQSLYLGWYYGSTYLFNFSLILILNLKFNDEIGNKIDRPFPHMHVIIVFKKVILNKQC